MQRKNLGSMLRKKKGGFIGPMLGLMAPIVGKLIGGLIPNKGSGIKGFGDGHPKKTKTKKTKSGKGIFDIVKKIASNPVAKLATDALKKKIVEMAVNKSVDLAKKKVTKGNGVKRTKKMHTMNMVGVPSYNKNASVTITKPMREIKNPIKPARKKDFYI